ncbi:hypothetical protein BJX64DRAFT_176817 [Aspergillus heterothallicus]
MTRDCDSLYSAVLLSPSRPLNQLFQRKDVRARRKVTAERPWLSVTGVILILFAYFFSVYRPQNDG